MSILHFVVLFSTLGCTAPVPSTAPPAPASDQLVQDDRGACFIERAPPCPPGPDCIAVPQEAVTCPPLAPTRIVREAAGCFQEGPWQCGVSEGVCSGKGRFLLECPPVLETGQPGDAITQHPLYGCILEKAGTSFPLLCHPVLERSPARGITFRPLGNLLCEAVPPVRCPTHVDCAPAEPELVICPPEHR